MVSGDSPEGLRRKSERISEFQGEQGVNEGFQMKRSYKVQKDAKSKFLNFDVYGKPVSLTFKGNDKYRTVPGVIITVFVGIFVLLYASFTATHLFG